MTRVSIHPFFYIFIHPHKLFTIILRCFLLFCESAMRLLEIDDKIRINYDVFFSKKEKKMQSNKVKNFVTFLLPIFSHDSNTNTQLVGRQNSQFIFHESSQMHFEFIENYGTSVKCLFLYYVAHLQA